MDVTQRKITKIAREVSKLTTRMLRDGGVGSSELDFIHAVRKNPGASQAKICQILGLDKGAAARLTANLEAKGYLTRRQDPADGRSRLLYATDKADGLKNSKAQIEAAFYSWLTQPLNDGEKEELARLLDVVYQRCKKESKAEFIEVTEFIKRREVNE